MTINLWEHLYHCNSLDLSLQISNSEFLEVDQHSCIITIEERAQTCYKKSTPTFRILQGKIQILQTRLKCVFWVWLSWRC